MHYEYGEDEHEWSTRSEAREGRCHCEHCRRSDAEEQKVCHCGGKKRRCKNNHCHCHGDRRPVKKENCGCCRREKHYYKEIIYCCCGKKKRD